MDPNTLHSALGFTAAMTGKTLAAAGINRYITPNVAKVTDKIGEKLNNAAVQGTKGVLNSIANTSVGSKLIDKYKQNIQSKLPSINAPQQLSLFSGMKCPTCGNPM